MIIIFTVFLKYYIYQHVSGTLLEHFHHFPNASGIFNCDPQRENGQRVDVTLFCATKMPAL